MSESGTPNESTAFTPIQDGTKLLQLSIQDEMKNMYPAVENFSAWRSKIVARRW